MTISRCSIIIYIAKLITTKIEWRIYMNYVCELCGYVYKPHKGDVDNGIEPGTDYEDLPEDWTCPLCGASKEDFEPDNDGKSIYDTTEEF